MVADRTFDYTFGALQVGLDLYSVEHQNGHLDNAGVYLAVGHGELDVEHNLLGFTFKGGEDSFNAVSLGGYWTHFGPEGWYLDGVVQATWYDMDMSCTARPAQRQKQTAWGLAASLEGGYPFDFGDGWQFEPQAQLVYQALDISAFNDGAADVRFSDEDSLAGRVGAKLSRTWAVGGEDYSSGNEAGAPPRQFTIWGRADLWSEFLGEPVTEFSSATGFIPFTANLGDSWARLGIGGTFELTDSTTLYGNVNYETDFNNALVCLGRQDRPQGQVVNKASVTSWAGPEWRAPFSFMRRARRRFRCRPKRTSQTIGTRHSLCRSPARRSGGSAIRNSSR